jgi:hypothetical protein
MLLRRNLGEEDFGGRNKGVKNYLTHAKLISLLEVSKMEFRGLFLGLPLKA